MIREMATSGQRQPAKFNMVGLDSALSRHIQNASLFRRKPEPSHEKPILEVVHFSPEDRSKLEDSGFTILSLTKRSIKTEVDANKPFWTKWHKDYPVFENLTSRASEVAVNLAQLYLPNSNNLTLAAQLEMVKAYSVELQQKLGTNTVQAIIGEAPDYVELAFAHLAITGEYIFGQNFGYNFARTTTPVTETTVADVGCFGADSGLVVLHSNGNHGGNGLFAVPLIVPSLATYC